LLLQKHGCGKIVHDDLLQFLFRWTKNHPKNVFQQKRGMPAWTRERVIEELEVEYQSSEMKSENHHVRLHDGRSVTIHVIDFGPEVRDVLDDPWIHENIADGIDRETFRPIVQPELHENDPNAIIGEKHTGFLYQRAIDLHCPSGPDIDPKLVRPLVLMFHIDKSHADLFGSLCLTPIQWSLAMIVINGQYNIRSWRVLAYIPNLSKGKGSAEQKKKTLVKKTEEISTNACVLHCLLFRSTTMREEFGGLTNMGTMFSLSLSY
jgi:hypothetical protein